jgi:hypothetical protein
LTVERKRQMTKATKKAILRDVDEVLVVPLGRAPGKKELEEALRWIWGIDFDLYYWRRTQRAHSLLQTVYKEDLFKAEQALGEFVLGALDKVRAKEGLLFFQVDGASLAGAEVREGDKVAVLTAVGVHGRTSAYILHYASVRAGQDGRLPYLPIEVLAGFRYHLEVQRELQVVQEELLTRLPALRKAVRQSQDPPLLVTAVERGQITFAIDHRAKVKYALVGETVLTVFQMSTRKGNQCRWLGEYDARKVLEGTDEELSRDLRRRTYLRFMPRGAVLDLLRGKGNPEEARRVLAMVGLAGF